MPYDPKRNSVVGQFKMNPVQGTRESYKLIDPQPAAIEALAIENAGNNCIWGNKPHIINATNIDTERVLGEIGVKAAIAKLTAGISESVTETISYDGFTDNLPPIGSDYTYHLQTVIWIGEQYNAETDDEMTFSKFNGMDFLFPSYLNLDLPPLTNGGSMRILRTPLPGMAYSVFANMANGITGDIPGPGGLEQDVDVSYKYPRSLLLISFQFAVLLPGTTLLNTQNARAFIQQASTVQDETGGARTFIYPSFPSTTKIKSRLIFPETQIVVPGTEITPIDILPSEGSGTYDDYVRITVDQYNPYNNVYYAIWYPEDEDYSNPDLSILTLDNPGYPICYYDNGGIFAEGALMLYRTCKLVLAQKLMVSGTLTLVTSPLVYEYTLSLPEVTDPVITYYKSWTSGGGFVDEVDPPTLNETTADLYVKLEHDPLADPDEAANTKIFYQANNAGSDNFDDYLPVLGLEYSEDNPPHIIGTIDSETPQALFAAQIRHDPLASVKFQDGAINGIYHIPTYDGQVPTLPVPAVTPPGGSFTDVGGLSITAAVPSIYLPIYENLQPHLWFKYAWRKPSLTTMDPSLGLEAEDFDEGTAWDFEEDCHTIAPRVIVSSGYPTIPAGAGWTYERNTLYVCFVKEGFTSTVGSYTFSSVPVDPTKGKSGRTYNMDGFDNKYVKKEVEYFKYNGGLSDGSGYNSVNRLRIEFNSISDVAVSQNYIDETDPEKLSETGLFPVYAKAFMAIPSIESPEGMIYPLYKSSIVLPAQHRKQRNKYRSGLNSSAIDTYTQKKSVTVYEDDTTEIRLNVYNNSQDEYSYCFSVCDIANLLETYPNNFGSDVLTEAEADSICITRIQIIDEIDSGSVRAVISFNILGNEHTVYLELTKYKDYYSEIADSSVTQWLLNELYVDHNMNPCFDTVPTTPDRPAMTGSTYSGPLGNDNEFDDNFRFMSYIPAAMYQKLVSASILSGNSMAVSAEPRFTNLPVKLAFGCPLFVSTEYFVSKATMVWRDGLEKYTAVSAFPCMFPCDMRLPISGLSYALKALNGDWRPMDPAVLYDYDTEWEFDNESVFVSPESWEKIYGCNARLEDMYYNHMGLSSILNSSGNQYTGTILCIQPPAMLAGNAYNEIRNSIQDLKIEFTGNKLIYGYEETTLGLVTKRGLYQPSYWPYMSSSGMRISELGVTSQIILMENYIFTHENGYACVYFNNEKQGKTLIFNELGTFADYPVIYKGYPVFSIVSGTTAIIYRGTQDGIVPIHRFDQCSEIHMVHISGTNPLVFIKSELGYDIWEIDTNAVYYTNESEFEGTITVKRISTPSSKTIELISGDIINTLDYSSNYEMTIESSDVYPSALSYEYEQYTFVVNGIIIRFDQAIRSLPFELTVFHNGNTAASSALYRSISLRTADEVKICLDATPVRSLKYIMTSRTPVRSVRFTGHFVEDMKVE